MIISLPDDLDLLMIEKGEGPTMERTMSIKLGEQMFGPVDNKGSFAVLAPMLMEARPHMFTDVTQTAMSLMMLHSMLLSKHTNRAGMDYPYKIPAEAN